MMVDFQSIKWKRIGLQAAFWSVIGILMLTILLNFVNVSNSNQLSAYDDDWDDLSAFRGELNDMGVTTRSLVSSPLLLADIDDPRNTTFIINGVERDTLSLPQFDPDGLISFSREDGYSNSEIRAIVDFVEAGGNVVVFEDFGYSSSIAKAFGVNITGYQVYDRTYATELDFNYIWMCMQENPCGMNGTSIDPTTINTHSRWGDTGDSVHPCSLLDGQTMRYEEAGLCRQHWTATSGEIGEIRFNASYTVLMNNATGLEIMPGVQGALNDVNIMAVTSNEATVDTNGDGEIWVGNEVNAETPDLWGQFNLSIEACADKSCDPDEGGRILFVADGSVLVNALYDYENFNDGLYDSEEYGDVTNFIPENSNRRWILDVIAESLAVTDGEDVGQPRENALVIFDESRHPQNAILAEAYNTVYFLLVYSTGEGLAVTVLLLALFVVLEGILLKKRDPEPWRHVFSIIYYGLGDHNRYQYYSQAKKIRQVFMSKVRNQNGLTRDEFNDLPAQELVRLINDPVLAKFALETKDYDLASKVAIIKRIKSWGRS